MKNLSSNVLFSFILTAANYIFPFLVFPYVSRVLGPDNFGICNFVDAIVTWASLVSMMGVTILGVRSVAKHKQDRAQLNKAFTSLFILSGSFTLIATALLVGAACLIPALAYCRELLLVGLIKLWGNFLLLEWLYKGLEDFRYITLRTIIVKLLFVAAVYIFIRNESDYAVYFLLMVQSVAVNAAINCLRASGLVKFSVSMESLRALWGPFIILGIYLLLNSMYTTFNVMYLGFVANDTEVGYYTAATKIFKIILAMYTAYSVVILPRASALMAQGQHEEFRRLIGLSIQGLMLFAIPVVIFGVAFSQGIVELIAGGQYGGAILPMMIVMPLIFIVGYEQILVMQILTPMASDRVILLNSITGASVGVGGNILLVGILQSVGSAIVWVLAEIAVLLVAQHFVGKKAQIYFPWRLLGFNIAVYLPFMAIAVGILLMPWLTPIMKMVLGGIILVFYFAGAQKFFLKNPVYNTFQEKLLQMVKKVF